MTEHRAPAAPDFAAVAIRTVKAEAAGLTALSDALGGPLGRPFSLAVKILADAPGRVAVCGMGKSGHVARKVAATFASTGTPAFFLHPAEASHGDLGMLAAGDVVLALSWSGETPELRDVVHYAKRFAIPLIAITAEASGALAGAADVALILPKSAEACPNGQAPTTSTTMQMALGDALAMALIEAKGFSATDFKTYHPGGRLGAQLISVGDLMTKGPDVARVTADSSLSAAIVEMTRGRLGGVAVVDADGRLVGAFTDGDLRRALTAADLTAPVSDHMNAAPIFVGPRLLVSEALNQMNARAKPITLIFVCDDQRRLVGAAHMHDFLRAGVV